MANSLTNALFQSLSLPVRCLLLAGAGSIVETHTDLLYSHPLAQEHLAPSLLLLYGDVEHTGYVARMCARDVNVTCICVCIT